MAANAIQVGETHINENGFSGHSLTATDSTESTQLQIIVIGIWCGFDSTLNSIVFLCLVAMAQ